MNENEVADLRAEVKELQAALASSTQEETGAKQGATWPDDYQETWVEICAVILKGAAEADPSAAPAKGICTCSLNGLMRAFKLRDYESWTQELKDSAAAPYVTMCWSQ